MIKTFTVNADWEGIINKLSDKQAGQLFKNIFNYVNDTPLIWDDKATEIAFEPIRLQIDKKKPTKKSDKSPWRTSFDVYLQQLRVDYRKIINDDEFIRQQQKFYPNVDIRLSLEKACLNFWATKEGWNHKKKTRTNNIDWKVTLTNAIGINRVYISKEEVKPQMTWKKKLT